MTEYELYRQRSEEFLQRAARYRLAREAAGTRPEGLLARLAAGLRPTHRRATTGEC